VPGDHRQYAARRPEQIVEGDYDSDRARAGWDGRKRRPARHTRIDRIDLNQINVVIVRWILGCVDGGLVIGVIGQNAKRQHGPRRNNVALCWRCGAYIPEV
jgi:hypothetical protein